MSYFKLGILSALVATTALAGCTSQRFASINTRPVAASSTIAEPLEPAPAGTVTAGQLPPPSGAGTLPPGAFPAAPTGPTGQGTQVAAAPANAPDITAGSVAGVWNATVAGQGCRIATPQTKFGQGFRAGPLRCPTPLNGVKSWNVEGKQLALYDESGGVLARLYASGGERFDGQTSTGLPVSLSR
jgi:hypothetical protein